ncbi:MAG TPA: glycoside hydrolase, partial [Paludibacteraceae bacterium]|nr:glycoside hydrolase [Paludibacteraceae bacterium]
LVFSPSKIGESAGLVVMGQDYAAITVDSTQNGLFIKQTICKEASKGNAEVVTDSVLLKKNIPLYFRVEIRQTEEKNREEILQPLANCQFSYSWDGKKYVTIGKSFIAKEGLWIGAKVGIFCKRPHFSNDAGYVDVDWFRVESVK